MKMVQLNGFGVEIIPKTGVVDKFDRHGARYVGMDNGTEYKIKLSNYRDTRCDVDLKLEGTSVGRWRIDPHESITLERPVKEDKKFTFFSEMSMEVIDSGVIPKERNNGVVEAVFYPEKVTYKKISQPSYQPITPNMIMTGPDIPRSEPQMNNQLMGGNRGYEGGTTLLGGQSDQRFLEIKALDDDQINWNEVTTIYLRLVARKPVSSITTPYPPRLNQPFPRISQLINR